MVPRTRPTVRRKRLGAVLRRLRLAAGVSMEEAAQRIDGDKPKLSRIENGRMNVRRLEVEALLDLYGVTDRATVGALVELARQGRRKGWWHQCGQDLDEGFQERLDLEDDAVRIHVYQPFLVPGLLQTPEYARRVIREAERDAGDAEISKWVEMRMARQGIFGRSPAPGFVCVLDEAVIRRRVGGPDVLASQLEALRERARPPEVTIQVIPFGEGWHAGLDGAFAIHGYPDPLELDIVSIDYLDGTLYLEEDASVERYRRAFDQLRASALSSRQSMELITRYARELREEVVEAR
ncbi:helix-turn-helix domain-containing protein [Streptomyces alkaliphilus]|uniref:helix-turn-helix domain-containing protein n=1 Tax=Streptomyces alkaliphilus TaxID=1472722 RepID=UPI00117E9B3A|nr:helix-turn-helix transcriptional regulator [Streptomyces alkaliphilus]MQS08574.1 helix-turn-helix domain-containing protein [Streptomyces alkaliphilus]